MAAHRVERDAIVHHAASLGPDGSKRQLVNLAAAMAGRGAAVTVLTTARPSPTTSHFLKAS
jgi:hypothetical protein